jgi:3-methylcrotonyl-CoA carboxylase alpha subunit
LLARVAAHPKFAAAAIDTGFIERHRDVLLPGPQSAPEVALAAAALAQLRELAAAAKAAAARSEDPNSPWASTDGWRLNGKAHLELRFQDGPEERGVIAEAGARDWRLQIGEKAFRGLAEPQPDGRLRIDLDGVSGRITILDHQDEVIVLLDGEHWRLVASDPLAVREGEDPAAGRLTAPMPGRVTQLMVGVGDSVRRGEPLMIIEAMKMEHTVAAPADGTIDAVRFAVGDLVEEGAELISLDTSTSENRN